MDITYFGKNTIKLRGKSASIIIDPQPLKNTADAIVWMLDGATDDIAKIEGVRLIINGTGEYEVGGIKISGFRVNNTLGYALKIDGIEIAAVAASTLPKVHDRITECDIIVLNADAPIDESEVAKVSPKVLVLVGSHAPDLAKALGKEDVQQSAKFQITKDKLPEEMQVVILGST